MSNSNPTYVVYHSPCFDGFCARWAAWKALGDENVHYIPANFGDPVPEFPEDALVVMVDISWPRSEILRLRDSVRDLIILDHHQTAQEDLSGLSFATFDMDKSGARLAWEFFHPGKSIPAIVWHVEDRDLWRFDSDKTRMVHAYLSTLPFEIEAWDEAAVLLADRFSHAVSIGARVLKYENIRCNEAAELAHYVHLPPGEEPKCPPSASGSIVLAVNLGLKHFVSETLHLLLDRHSDENVVASYHQGSDGRWNWSLRSREGYDCSWIARAYGGGGHKQACGFMTDGPPEHWDRAESE